MHLPVRDGRDEEEEDSRVRERMRVICLCVERSSRVLLPGACQGGCRPWAGAKTRKVLVSLALPQGLRAGGVVWKRHRVAAWGLCTARLFRHMACGTPVGAVDMSGGLCHVWRDGWNMKKTRRAAAGRPALRMAPGSGLYVCVWHLSGGRCDGVLFCVCPVIGRCLLSGGCLPCACLMWQHVYAFEWARHCRVAWGCLCPRPLEREPVRTLPSLHFHKRRLY